MIWLLTPVDTFIVSASELGLIGWPDSILFHNQCWERKAVKNGLGFYASPTGQLLVVQSC